MVKTNEYFIPIFVESRYKVNRKQIATTISSVLKQHGVNGPAEVSVAIVGDRKMRSLNKTYKGEDKATNILSFSLIDGKQVVLPPKDLKTRNDVLRLGDIILSYPHVIKEAVRDEMMVDDKVDQLLQHGLQHLLGVHHE